MNKITIFLNVENLLKNILTKLFLGRQSRTLSMRLTLVSGSSWICNLTASINMSYKSPHNRGSGNSSKRVLSNPYEFEKVCNRIKYSELKLNKN